MFVDLAWLIPLGFFLFWGLVLFTGSSGPSYPSSTPDGDDCDDGGDGGEA
ncbi:hypothetical protein Q0Z83_048890 [Actinoplanes sichuanensis]|uniref:Uncharacterized protein n=1 Tax=Actinoplanes sichuanensis TaxID=512349 RepID=A0ABW4AQM0_9ACTN|nr:hypothetical protein [Actinoplanes sichuanensis]BEL06698.1 hypothetical protein Q0Z83_048890 [Actinoplanes sichuanensis]